MTELIITLHGKIMQQENELKYTKNAEQNKKVDFRQKEVSFKLDRRSNQTHYISFSFTNHHKSILSVRRIYRIFIVA